jgi:hypothetical protein
MKGAAERKVKGRLLALKTIILKTLKLKKAD